MKKIVAWISVLSLMTKMAVAEDNYVIKVRADFWCPYNCKSKSNNPGYMVEILQKAFGKNHIDYAELNWARSIEDTRQGEYDAIVGAAKSEAPDFIFPESPAGKANSCFYTKKSNPWTYKGIDSLKEVNLGVIKDYAYFDGLLNYINMHENRPEKLQIHTGTDALIKMLQKLSMDRISALVEDSNVMTYATSIYPIIIDIKEAGCVSLDPLYIAFSPANPSSKQRAKLLNKTILSMEKNGEMLSLLKKYKVKPWY